MAEYLYKKYEDGKGFEEYQAQIYNSNANKYNGQPVTAEAIKKRLHDHTPTQDKKGMTFAFDKDMKPVAYIQYREYAQGKVRIGYPWSVEGTPQKIKDKLFYDLFDYLKNKYPEKKEFYLGFVNYAYTGPIDEIKNHYGFKEDSMFAVYSLDVHKASTLELIDGLSFKEITINDLPLLIAICLSDVNVSKQGSERITDFFKTRFFLEENNDKLALALLKNNEPIGMVAVSKTKQGGKDYSNIRLLALKEGEEASYKYLISTLGRLLEMNNWTDPISFNLDKAQKDKEEILKNLGGEFISKAYEFKITLD